MRQRTDSRAERAQRCSVQRRARWVVPYSSGSAWGSLREQREADRFFADLMGYSGRSLGWSESGEAFDAEVESERWEELVEVCGFFGPNDVRRTDQEIRNAVVARANAEWTAWHTAAGVPRAESDAGMFGRLVGYSLAADRDVAPDHLTALQAAAVGTINYAPLLSATVGAVASQVTTFRARLITAAGVPDTAALRSSVATALTSARQANKDSGPFSSWSAVFVVACVRGAAIALGLEAIIPPGRVLIGQDELLKATIRHSEYTTEARRRRAARTPRRRGTYHAFTPAQRQPQLGDIIVQDRRDSITAARVTTLAALPERHLTHGDIIVEVQATFVTTIGGNLNGPLGESSRKRRYPRNAQGFLVVDPPQLFAQEDDAGALAALPLTSTTALDGHSTARIFALLSPVEECAAVPGQPYHGGVLT